ncbi:uncharacterized protein LOC134818351 isoform X1 [Bolinopsis microptera]|uniref:uncharacterized protein LOC134818351 isoform X1 n=1 Tax=Bolinopsis microptera TaxID=2820187 RepID=UPI003079EE6B
MMVRGGKQYCKFYLQGHCKNGAKCAFEHERPKCHFYSKGMCFRGNLCYFVHAEPEHTDAALMITKIDEIGALPFKSPPPVCQTNLTRDGLVRKLRGIQKRAGTVEDYYERFNEVLEEFYLYEITRDDMIEVLQILCEDDEVTNVYKFTITTIFENWCISCRHWADFFLALLMGDKTELTDEQMLDAVKNFDSEQSLVMIGTLIVGLLTLEKQELALALLLRQSDGKSLQDFSVYLKILAAYLQPSVIASFLRTHIQQYNVQEDEFCRCPTYVCRCPTKVDPGRTADMVDTIQEVVAWTDFEKRDFIKTMCHGLFKRPDIQEIADIVRFENDMVRAEAVCDTLAKPMSDVEKQHLRRVFHRAFGVHPRAINYHLSQTDPLRRRQTILKLGIDPNEILSAGEVWSGIYKPLEIENKENKMNVEALENDKCQSPYINCRNRPKDVCDRGLCRRCCVDFGKKMGTDCYGHMLFFTEGDFSDSEQDNSVNKRRELGMVPKINFPYFKPRVSLYGEPNLDEAIRSKCRYQRIDCDPSFHIQDDQLIKLVKKFSTDVRCLSIGSKETKAGLELTKESLQELSKCRNLHKLSLECCVNVDDDTFKRILEGCPKLKYLEVSGCHKHTGKLTSKSLEYLFSESSHLQFLNIEFQREISAEILARLKRRRPALVTCDVYTNEKRTADSQMQHMIRQLTELTPSEGGEIIYSSVSESSDDDNLNISAADRMSKEADELIMRFSPECAFAIGAGGKAVPLANIEEEEGEGFGGFSVSECDELLQQGVKPWEEDAAAVLGVLNGDWADLS